MKAPSSLEDAQLLYKCHEQAVQDFQIQIEMVDQESGIIHYDGELLPYGENKALELEEKRLKLLSGKRFHLNAKNAYWYYLMKNKT